MARAGSWDRGDLCGRSSGFFFWFSREHQTNIWRQLTENTCSIWFFLVLYFTENRSGSIGSALCWCWGDGVWLAWSCPRRTRGGAHACAHAAVITRTPLIPFFTSLREKSEHSWSSSWVHSGTALLYPDRARGSHGTSLTLKNASRVGNCRSRCVIFPLSPSCLRVTSTAPGSAWEGLTEKWGTSGMSGRWGVRGFRAAQLSLSWQTQNQHQPPGAQVPRKLAEGWPLPPWVRTPEETGSQKNELLVFFSPLIHAF